ncbi:Peptidoglycan/xylan/chitin deacetylase, PgdA/CDA1 family [Granulicella rosea]|uniref:Peptidoglycan/xylan/chitin deacetylase, PgdA/CDA1 family n=1 Tax=Granulicella rosea TaxID=474952 RepID=A0A239D537_9BACT|nr:polysaccharide deacetylase family protein [Granulicella rosea]SNS27349.1 Peptidoglycan/xylan/chitin deacetylase, PgdA/CDA1 family [Granulicella rosea]
MPRLASLLTLLLFALPAAAQQIAFTFDDLPAHGALPAGMKRIDIANSVLDTLRREKMPPTYGFVNGIRVQESPETLNVLKAWRAAGQPLASHTWSHIDLTTATPEQFEADILKNEPLLESLMPSPDQNWRYLRYPYLHEGETLEKRRAVRAWLTEHRYRIAETAMDFNDYLWNDPYARCVAQHDDKSIAYLHDSYLATAEQFMTLFRGLSKDVYGHEIPYVLLMHLGAFDAKMLPELIAMYRSHGFTFVTLEQAQSDPAYAHDPDIALKYGGTLIEQEVAARKIRFPANHLPEKELAEVCKAPAK